MDPACGLCTFPFHLICQAPAVSSYSSTHRCQASRCRQALMDRPVHHRAGDLRPPAPGRAVCRITSGCKGSLPPPTAYQQAACRIGPDRCPGLFLSRAPRVPQLHLSENTLGGRGGQTAPRRWRLVGTGRSGTHEINSHAIHCASDRHDVSNLTMTSCARKTPPIEQFLTWRFCPTLFAEMPHDTSQSMV